MILIDTNVVSELMRLNLAPTILDWFAHQDANALHFSAIAEAELRRGAAILPKGKRRDGLIAAIDAMVAEELAGRVWPFDSAAAVAFAAIWPSDQLCRLSDPRDRRRSRCRPGDT